MTENTGMTENTSIRVLEETKLNAYKRMWKSCRAQRLLSNMQQEGQDQDLTHVLEVKALKGAGTEEPTVSLG